MNLHVIEASRPRHRCGAVLFIVLGIIFATSIVVSLFIELQIFRLRESAADYASDRLRVAAYSTLETTLAVLTEFKTIDGALYSSAQGWSDPLRHAPDYTQPEGTTVSVSIQDESGKRSLTAMGEAELTSMLEQLDIDLYEAQMMAQSFLDWTDTDELQRLNGAEKDYYGRENPAYEPPNRPLASYEELRYIRGFRDTFFDESGAPNERFTRFKSITTVHNIGSVNFNTASAELIEAMNTQDNYAVTQLYESLAGLDGEIGTEDDIFIKDLPGNTRLPNTGSTISHLRIRIEVTRGLASFTLEALMATTTGNNSGNMAYPFTFIALSENAPLP